MRNLVAAVVTCGVLGGGLAAFATNGDELMGVGDMKFQKKSTIRMKELITESKALVVVSHSMGTIRDLCSRVVWLEKGEIKAQGQVEEVVAQYEAQ